MLLRWIFIALVALLTVRPAWGAEGTVEFARDVRPILGRHCFKCHGPDDAGRQAGLRLDLRDAAIAPADSGEKAIVPGKPDESELFRRVTSSDEDSVMPPPATKNPLTDAERETLHRWIAAGAKYQPHWAFAPPVQASTPAVKQSDWPRNPIDHFVLHRLEREGLAPSPQADKYTLARRVYLDLIGLPPTPEEVDTFVNDSAPDAYEKLVDRLMVSPHYGERWARRWLDLARYADTNGYEKDRPRSIWPYRDWVINAFNDDMPFDQFTIEQLAGDMLLGATVQQRVATGFNRNTMLNEEGGIDPLEFRFNAMVDRVNTTATTWLGLTLGCTQCHTHKYDPIPHAEYYRMMALMNNTEEPKVEVPMSEQIAQRRDLESQIAEFEADLPNRFPIESDYQWQTPQIVSFASTGQAAGAQLADGSVRVSGENPERDVYTVVIENDLADVAFIKLETITDPEMPHGGPGRTEHGNFVLSELTVSAAPRDGSKEPQTVKFISARAEFSQDGYAVAQAVDNNTKTGWAIYGKEPWNVNRTAWFTLEKPTGFPNGTRWTIRLDQQYGSQHTLGRFRISLGRMADSLADAAAHRKQFDQSYADWLQQQSDQAVRWTILKPTEAKSDVPFLLVLDDNSVLVGGDQAKRDVYDLKYQNPLRGVTAVRLEALPDDRLPNRGPGRVSYEGALGDFYLNEFTLKTGGQLLKLKDASQTHGKAALAIDGDPQTGWSIDGGQGQPQAAVFNFAEPLAEPAELALQMIFERYFAAGLGRFRISVTTDPQGASAHGHPGAIEDLLAKPADQRTVAEQEQLLRYYVSTVPELAFQREVIKKIRDQIPEYSTSLVMAERPTDHPRSTFRHHRGEFLQPKEQVEPDVLSILPPLPKDAPRNRLSFARWLVNGSNPLVGRVTMNRQWAAFFGRALVRTSEDFGFQGELPSHPELLDWLAVELVNQRWSLKKMQRLIVTSSTYRQSSRVTPELIERDPQNKLLTRGPRFRLEAELVRDAALRISGLLSTKLGGPSVFPPQPPSITSEGTYGALTWDVSTGEDRYRRGLYTFSKRTAPYAMFVTFDAPSGEACLARREVSNSPLQSLALLNDVVFVEASQALGREIAALAGTDQERAMNLFRRVLARPPSDEEQKLLLDFLEVQRSRLTSGELKANTISGSDKGDMVSQAAWTLAARGLLNLDETVTKE